MKGFNGGTDATDDRIIWVTSDLGEQAFNQWLLSTSLMTNGGFGAVVSCSALPDPDGSPIDYCLPEQIEDFQKHIVKARHLSQLNYEVPGWFLHCLIDLLGDARELKAVKTKLNDYTDADLAYWGTRLNDTETLIRYLPNIGVDIEGAFAHLWSELDNSKEAGLQIHGRLESPKLAPPQGFDSWLDYVVESTDVSRSINIESLFGDTEISRDDVRAAIKDELDALRKQQSEQFKCHKTVRITNAPDDLEAGDVIASSVGNVFPASDIGQTTEGSPASALSAPEKLLRNRKYRCEWPEGYGGAKPAEVGYDFFTADAGYNAADLVDIAYLQLGENTKLTDLMSVHTVTRIK